MAKQLKLTDGEVHRIRFLTKPEFKCGYSKKNGHYSFWACYVYDVDSESVKLIKPTQLCMDKITSTAETAGPDYWQIACSKRDVCIFYDASARRWGVTFDKPCCRPEAIETAHAAGISLSSRVRNALYEGPNPTKKQAPKLDHSRPDYSTKISLERPINLII